jgi:acyl carrier protein
MHESSTEKLDRIVADILELDVKAISDALTPDDVEQWTSLNHLRLVTAVEEAFGISLSMEQIESIRSIGAMRKLVCTRPAAS